VLPGPGALEVGRGEGLPGVRGIDKTALAQASARKRDVAWSGALPLRSSHFVLCPGSLKLLCPGRVLSHELGRRAVMSI
jgi:hypothetical protein